MNFDDPFIFFFCALGVFNCFLVSLYFLFFRKQSYVKNFIFGWLTLFLSIRVGKTVYMSFTETKDLLLAQIGLSACFLIGISLYYYIKASMEKKQKLPKWWLIHFVSLCVIILLVGVLRPYSSAISFWNQYFIWFIYLIWGVYLLLSGYELRTILYQLGRHPKKVSTFNSWLAFIFLGNLLIYSSYIVGYFWLYLVEMLTFSVVFYALITFFLSKKDRNIIFQKIPEKYADKKIDAREAKNLANHLSMLMKDEQLYKNPNLKLKEVAAKMNISQHKLSQLLNDNLGESFNHYINRHRVENAIELFEATPQYTLEAIGYDSGFTSKSVFYATFKKITGKTPSNFRKKFN